MKTPSYEESRIKPPTYLPPVRPANTRKAQAEFLEERDTWGYHYSANVRLNCFIWGHWRGDDGPFEEIAHAELEHGDWHEWDFIALESQFNDETGYHIDFAGRSGGQLILTDSDHRSNRESIAVAGTCYELTDVLFAYKNAWEQGLKEAGHMAQADAVAAWIQTNTDNEWLQERLRFYRTALTMTPENSPIVLYWDMERVSRDLSQTVKDIQTAAEKASHAGRSQYRRDVKAPAYQSHYLAWTREDLREEVDLVWSFYSAVEEMAQSFAFHVWDRVNEESNNVST